MIQKIYQVDNHSFAIEWMDGAVNHYHLSDLQNKCPCANCVDEKSGHRILEPKGLNPDLRALNIENVGRYALRIQFSTGCSHGIFGFDMLRNPS